MVRTLTSLDRVPHALCLVEGRIRSEKPIPFFLIEAGGFCREVNPKELDALENLRLHVWINSLGGSTLERERVFQIIEGVHRRYGESIAYVTDVAKSAAGSILLVCNKGFVIPDTRIMFHTAWYREAVPSLGIPKGHIDPEDVRQHHRQLGRILCATHSTPIAKEFSRRVSRARRSRSDRRDTVRFTGEEWAAGGFAELLPDRGALKRQFRLMAPSQRRLRMFKRQPFKGFFDRSVDELYSEE